MPAFGPSRSSDEGGPSGAALSASAGGNPSGVATIAAPLITVPSNVIVVGPNDGQALSSFRDPQTRVQNGFVPSAVWQPVQRFGSTGLFSTTRHSRYTGPPQSLSGTTTEDEAMGDPSGAAQPTPEVPEQPSADG
jgi:hypothetical protein